MENHIKDHTRDKLYRSTYDCRTEEQQREIMRHRLEEPYNAIESYAVYGTMRSVQKSPVDEFTLGNTVINYLDDPADEAVDKEHYHGVDQRERKNVI